ncbi:MAG: hypothetical protein ACN6OP_22730 [Pseudomonadales bacterium]
MVSVKHVARLLGLPAVRIRALLDMQELAFLDRGVSLTSAWAFHDRMLALVEANSLEPAQPVSLNTAFKTLIPRMLTPELVRAFRHHDIRIYINPRSSSQILGDRLLVCTTAVLEWRAAHRDASSASAQMLDISHTAKSLGVKPEVVTSLVSTGVLTPASPRRTARAPQYFQRGEIERFKANFVSLKSLASAAGIPPKHAPAWARQNGYDIAIGP